MLFCIVFASPFSKILISILALFYFVYSYGNRSLKTKRLLQNFLKLDHLGIDIVMRELLPWNENGVHL